MVSRALFFLLCVFLLLPVSPACRADSYALIVGIDNYQQSDAINGLAGASNDAKALAKTLQDVSGFPADHVRLLTSDGESKPTGDNITFELDQLSNEAKAGDTVFVFFSGHGIEMDGNTYLVPWDADARTESTLRRTSLREADVREQLSKISAKALILAFDMCRSDPRKGEKGVAHDNLLGRQAKDLVVVPASLPEGQSGPRAVVTLFSCSPGERSWEWRAKERGYFSYYLEQGLRRDAADGKGLVHVDGLITYLRKSVAAAVKREEGHEQTPYSNAEGADWQDLVLARVTPGQPHPGTEIVAYLTPTVPSETIDARVAASLAQGKKLFNAHEWDAAQVKYASAVDLQPSSAKALDGLGQAEIGLKQWDKAEALFQKAATLDPTFADPVNHLAVIAFKNHNYKAAASLVAKAIALNPKYADAQCNQGYLDLIVNHNLMEAERHIRRAVALDPSDSNNFVALAGVFFRRGDSAKALEYLHKALQVNPKDDQAADSLGQIAQKAEDNDAAERWYRKAMVLDPTDAQPVADLAGLTHSAKHDDEEAGRLFRKAMDLDPLNIAPVIGMARMYFDNKDYTEADRYARNAAEIDPQAADPPAVLALDSLGKRDFDTAEAQARQAVALDGTQGDYHLVLATCLLVEQQREAAMVEAKKAISLGYKEPNFVYTVLGLTP